jgi:hypothetical protein
VQFANRAATVRERFAGASNVRARKKSRSSSTGILACVVLSSEQLLAFMRLLAADASGRVDSSNAADFLPSIVSVPVLVPCSHLAFQHPANQFGNSRILFSPLPASPSSGFLANPYPDTLQHEISVALDTLIPVALR